MVTPSRKRTIPSSSASSSSGWWWKNSYRTLLLPLTRRQRPHSVGGGHRRCQCRWWIGILLVVLSCTISTLILLGTTTTTSSSSSSTIRSWWDHSYDPMDSTASVLNRNSRGSRSRSSSRSQKITTNDKQNNIHVGSKSSNNNNNNNKPDTFTIITSATVVQEEDVSDMSMVSNSPRVPTHTACWQTNGIYHIAMGDIEGGVGTAFFQLVLVQILYAQSVLNLTPWVHFVPNISHVIEDPIVHSIQNPNEQIHFQANVGPTITRVSSGLHWRDIVPGTLNTSIPIHPQNLSFAGSGIWGHYFDPISDYVPGDRSCANKLYVTLSLPDIYLIIPGLHGYWNYAIRCWRYDYLPEYIRRDHQSYYSWITPHRTRAANIVQQHLHYRTYLIQKVEALVSDCTNMSQTICLGIHIRHSDKAAGRRVVPIDEFLPFVQTFVQQQQQQQQQRIVYVATDSNQVLQEMHSTWPTEIMAMVRTANNIVRSSDTTAVFDLASHHRTNQEVLVEILALSKCHFLIHGHSAVSEAAIYNNLNLSDASVNLEDEDHLDANTFGDLVRLKIRGEPVEKWPKPTRLEDHWPPLPVIDRPMPSVTNHACDGFDGVLLISAVGRHATLGRAFFTAVLNQLLFAERYNLQPWIHLQNNTSSLIFDEAVHNRNQHTDQSFEMLNGMDVSVLEHEGILNSFYPGPPVLHDSGLSPKLFTVSPGNGVWATYFDPVSDFVPGDISCRSKPLIEISETLVTPGLELFSPWSIKAWRYDNIPASVLLKKEINSSKQIKSMEEWLEPMRNRAQELVHKYFNFQPYLRQRANEVNPMLASIDTCLGVHIRLSDKKGNFRRTVRAGEYQDYMDAFERAGGRIIYVASDTQRPLQYIYKNFPENTTKIIRAQGDHIVRSLSGDWPTHLLDNHHRVNSETLVDILALSKCSLMLHTYSTVSEAAIYLNPLLHKNSVNLEENERISPGEFEMLSRYVLGQDKTLQSVSKETIKKIDTAALSTPYQAPKMVRNKNFSRSCRTNAIVYLAQKFHSSYGRDSFDSLMQSLDLLNKNYLSINNHIDNTDIFIFHTGDFNRTDLEYIERQLALSSSVSLVRGVVRLVDLSGTKYWSRPRANANDDPNSWYAYPLFSEGYRRMMHWFAIDIWEFFDQWNKQSGCGYRYLFRLDEDSYIHSPIEYDIFDHMQMHKYNYGFRMCAYEMKVTQRMSSMWMNRHANFIPMRDIDLEMCGFYNNFFVADLAFFLSPQVSKFIRFIDSQGHIYRRRLGDLMIHSMAVYWYSPPEHIFRFLDFTYEHGTFNKTSGCLMWGGIQAGYGDPIAVKTLNEFYKKAFDLGCSVNTRSLQEVDLSPSYSRIPESLKNTLSLQTITAGQVELSGKGILSG